VLAGRAADDPEAKARMAAFLHGLQQLGWSDGRDVQIVDRWAAGADDYRKYAAELAALAPDVILANGSVAVGPMLQATRAVPIVFVYVPDPVGAGFVENLARPGGNATGFTPFEYSTSGKWLELLKQIAPSVTRAAVIRDPATSTGLGQFASIQALAPSLGVEVRAVNVHDAGEIERGVTAFARSSNCGLIVTGSALAAVHKDLTISLAARHNLPAVYFERQFVTAYGLMNLWAQHRRPVPACGRVRRSHPQGREASRPAGASVDQNMSWSSI
jgi:putative tryptophan/tyrosine transport system substrate-binding protein